MPLQYMLWTGGFAVNLPTPFLSMLFHCNLLEVCCFFTYVLVHCYHYSKWSRRNVWVDLKKVLLFAFKSHYHHDIYHCGLKNSSPSLRYEYAPHDKIGSHTERAIAIKNSRPEIQEGIREWKPLINSRIFFCIFFLSTTWTNLQSQPNVARTLELYHVSPSPLINAGKYRAFST